MNSNLLPCTYFGTCKPCAEAPVLLHNRIDPCFFEHLRVSPPPPQKGTALGSAPLLLRTESDWHSVASDWNRNVELRWLLPFFFCLWDIWHFAARSPSPFPVRLLHLERSVSIYVFALTEIKPVWHVQINSRQISQSGWTHFGRIHFGKRRDQCTHLVINSDRFNIRARCTSSQTVHIPSRRLFSITLIFTTGLVHTLSIWSSFRWTLAFT